MSVFVSLFVHLDWARFPLWVLALAVGGVAFGALGVAIGALAREVSASSLLAFLLSLPIAFVALVPANAVSGALKSVLNAVAFVFPFRPALQAVSNAFSGASPGIGWPLVHLAVLTVVFWLLARFASAPLRVGPRAVLGVMIAAISGRRCGGTSAGRWRPRPAR